MKAREPALVDLARELVLAAATFLVKSGDDRPDPRLGWEPAEEGRGVQAFRAGEQLSTELGLPVVDAWLVLLCVTAELFPDVSAAMGILGDDPQQQLPTPVAFARLMAGLGAGYGTALCAGLPGAPAERSGRIERLEAPAGRPWTAAPLRVTLRELRRWLGVSSPAPLPLLPTCSWTAADPAYLRRVAAMIPEGLVLRSADSRAVRQLLVDLGSVLGAAVSWVGEEPPETVLDAPGLAVLDYSSGQRPVPWALVRRLHGVKSLIVWVGAGAAAPGWSVVEPEPLGVAESRRIWTALAPQAVELAPWFLISAEELQEAVEEARNQRRLARQSGEPTAPEIRARVLATGARRMGRTVERIPALQGLDTLVVAPELRMQLDDMVAWYRAMPHVAARYRQGPGRGLTCLFAGPPGTGKTFAAGCLASTLGLNLYRVDLSQVVSKYIGETEKALAQVFAEAESGHGILLFDEADALFGKRSEVKDAHDRYANVEVSYLLARMD
ncbi:MAG TPA: ATP-binding protein, partial [Myxococcota bacterium]|nr:ATP-binding protein [Myxococcota bacterium]